MCKDFPLALYDLQTLFVMYSARYFRCVTTYPTDIVGICHGYRWHLSRISLAFAVNIQERLNFSSAQSS